MTAEERGKLTAAFQRDSEDDDALADVLFLYKLRVYEDTLGELADRYDFEYGEIQLSESIRDALRAEAEARAQQINSTYNGDITRYIAEIVDDATFDQAVDSIMEFTEAREQERAELVSLTESYPAHADATMSFFDANGLAPDFDFGGHGDDHPACPICAALESRNPHPLSRVLAIGSPHVQCRQNWHPLVDAEDLPDELVLGDHDPAGIVGNDHLLDRSGGTTGAVDQIESLD